MNEENLHRSPYNLRQRDALQPIERYGQSSIAEINRQREGKSSAVRKRVKDIHELIRTNGSRTKLKSLQNQLQVVFSEVCTCHEQLMAQLDENDSNYNDDYVEELRIDDDDCASNIEEYLQERLGDPPSRAASEICPRRELDESYREKRTRSWCAEHVDQIDVDQSEITHLSSQFKMLTCERSNPHMVRHGDNNYPTNQYTSTTSPLHENHSLSEMRETSNYNQQPLPYNTPPNPPINTMLKVSQHLNYVSQSPRSCSEEAEPIFSLRHSMLDDTSQRHDERSATMYDLTMDERTSAYRTGHLDQLISPPIASSKASPHNGNKGDGICSRLDGEDSVYFPISHGIERSIEHLPASSDMPIYPDYASGFPQTHLGKTDSTLPGHLMSYGNAGGARKRDYVSGVPGSGYITIPERSCHGSNTSTGKLPTKDGQTWSYPLHPRCLVDEEKIKQHARELGSHNDIEMHKNKATSTLDNDGCLRSYTNPNVSYNHATTPNVMRSVYPSGVNTNYGGGEQRQRGYYSDHKNTNQHRMNMAPCKGVTFCMQDGSTSYRTANTLNTPIMSNIGHQFSGGNDTQIHRDNQGSAGHVSAGDIRNTLHPRYSSVPFTHTQQISDASSTVDKWIDELPLSESEFVRQVEGTALSTNVMQRWMVNQQLPRYEFKKFDGSPLQWVDFITQFKELVHFQPFLSTMQRMWQLQQYLEKEAKRAVGGFKADWLGYRCALQRLKFMFGERARVAHAHISKVTKGESLRDNDMNALTEFYFDISDCLSNLQRLEYYSDLCSTDVLRQTIARLPTRLRQKWCERSYNIRRNEEPTLFHLEIWLKEKIMAARDPYMPQVTKEAKKQDSKYVLSKADKDLWTYKMDIDLHTPQEKIRNTMKCLICGSEDHRIFKCKTFLESDIEKRFKIVKDNKLCFNCLKPKHNSGECRSRYNCFSVGCKMPHHTTLHEYFQRKENIQKTTDNKEVTPPIKHENNGPDRKTRFENTKDGVQVGRTGTATTKVYTKIVPVIVTSDHVAMKSYAFLDDGSEGTFMREDLADQLKLTGTAKKVTIYTLTGEGEDIQAEQVSFTLCGKGKDPLKIKDAYILPRDKFRVKAQKIPTKLETDENYAHLREFKFENVDKDKVQIVVGADNYEAILVRKIKVGKNKKQPVAVDTDLGWAMFGRDDCHGNTGNGVQVNLIETEVSELQDSLTKFWTTDAFGAEFAREKSYSVQDKIVEEFWNESTQFTNGHYIVNMPWKKVSEPLPDNSRGARARFNTLINYFKRNPKVFELYREKIHEYVKKGYARKMSPEEIEIRLAKTWVLPHFPVLSASKPGKVRPVLDCAAKFEGICLNDHLFSGPDLVNSLIGRLLRFRNHPIAITADIESMFNQIQVSKQDSDSLRFLWKDDIYDLSEPDTFQMLTHVFGAKSSPSAAAYALKRAGLDSAAEFDNEVILTIIRDFYVDDLLKSVKSDNEAVNILTKVTEVLAKHGFNLTKYMSNSLEVLKSLPQNKLSKDLGVLRLEEGSNESPLGVGWNIKTDIFMFLTELEDQPMTARGILKTVASIFDPLGFVAPYVIRAKIILQNMWRKKYGWDTEVDRQDQETWAKWLAEIPSLSEFKIPRCYVKNFNVEVLARELHVFADASEAAFGAVAYVRMVYADGQISCCMYFARSRVAPIKTLTMPRLELQAAVLAVRVKHTIVTENDVTFDKIFFWSDSTIVLQYIHNESRRFKVFVANRVTEIRAHSEPHMWRYVKGDENPADDITRGLTISQMDCNSRWLRAPWYLYNPENTWNQDTHIDKVQDDDPEVKVVMKTEIVVRATERLKMCSSWAKVVRILCYVLRFLQGCKMQKHTTKYFTVGELHRAQSALIKLIQNEHYQEELDTISSTGTVPSCSSLIRLQPYMDAEGLLRVGGRLRKSNLPYNAKHQVILPSKDCLVERMVRQEHRMNIECGPDQLLAHLQQNYWIVGGKSLIKKILYQCIECRKRNSKPQIPLMADLPEFRVDMQCPVFFNTGVDLFGPIVTKLGRRHQKRWGAIFTCLVTRAVHLELAESLSTDDFINTLERFINRRGHPKKIVSDCGSNFKGANNELIACYKELKQDKIVEFTSRKSIDWIFIPPDAPHMGGAWERLVRTIKTPLKIILKDRVLTDFQLYTVFTEVEALVNSRPLTSVSEDINDLEAITPNHFLIGRQSPNLQFHIEYVSDSCTRKKWREVQFISNQFWRRWIREYLPTLNIRTKWNKECRNMEVGDLVMLVDKNAPRGAWKLGRVCNVHPGDDRRVRVVTVKTNTGQYTRPVAKVCLLEESNGQGM